MNLLTLVSGASFHLGNFCPFFSRVELAVS